jgi:hypothetical protein
MDKIIQAFFHQTFSQADARRRVALLEMAVEKALYTQGVQKSIADVVGELSRQPVDTAALTAFLASVTLPKDTTDMKKLMEAIREAILTRPSVVLAVPFDPTPEQTSAYGTWFRANVQPDILLNINFDASVVGGCSITWQGKQVTYDLEYLIKQKRNEIVAVVDQFVEKKRKEVVI